MDVVWLIEFVAGVYWNPDSGTAAPSEAVTGAFTSLIELQLALANFLDATGSTIIDEWAEVNPGDNEFWYCRYNEGDSRPSRIITVFAQKLVIGKLEMPFENYHKRSKSGVSKHIGRK